MSLSSADREDEVVRITLRIPKVLHERIVEASGNRSMNAEIIKRLWETFPARKEELRLHLENLRYRREAMVDQVARVSERIADIDSEIAAIASRADAEAKAIVDATFPTMGKARNPRP